LKNNYYSLKLFGFTGLFAQPVRINADVGGGALLRITTEYVTRILKRQKVERMSLFPHFPKLESRVFFFQYFHDV
jgi:hypothetical protein